MIFKRTTRFLAVIMAFVMMIAAFAPAGAEMVADLSVEKALSSAELNAALNVEGGTLEFTAGEEYSFVPVTDGDRSYAESTNAGVNRTSSIITTTVTAREGDIFSFDYFVSSEEEYDTLYLRRSNVTWPVLTKSGIMTEWETYTYTFSEDGEYTFTWEYYKDGSGAEGEDLARIDNVQLIPDPTRPPVDVELSAALNVEGGVLEFYTIGDYPFVPVLDGDRYYAAGTNFDTTGTTSTVGTEVDLNAGDTIQFEFCSLISDTTSFDFYVNDVLVYALGDMEATDWDTLNYTVTEAGEYTFTWTLNVEAADTADAFAYIDNVSVLAPVTSDELNAALNAEGGTLVFNTSATNPFTTVNDGERHYAMYEATILDGSSDSFVATSVLAAAGDVLCFDYYMSTGMDNFSLFVNGEAVFAPNGIMEGWTTFAYPLPAAGDYTFIWSYAGGYEHGYEHYVYLDNVEILPHSANADLNEALNVPGGNLDFITQEIPFVPVNDGERYYAESTVSMRDASSIIKTTVTALAGDTLSFDYYVDGSNEDFLALYVNDASEFGVYADSVEGWNTYTYTISETGEYTFTWQYYKYYSSTNDESYARIDNVVFASVLNDALNVEGGTLTFTTQDTPFTVIDDGERFFAESTVAGIDYAISTVKTTVNASAGDVISFDYFVSSENNYDLLNVYIEGAEEPIFEISGVMEGWATFTYTIPADGEYTFVWEYSKDMSDSYGEDLARLDNIQILPAEVVIPGDVDGDGIVDSTDALLILRYALGIIGEENLDIESADVNEDGTIDALDALFVLRMSLNVL